MKMPLIVLLTTGLIFSFFIEKGQKPMPEENPFLKTYNTPFQVPPFNEIKEEHYMPAFKAGIEEQKKEIDKIVNNKQEPTFANTLVALDKSGSLLNRVNAVFSHLTEANTTEGLQKIAQEVAPLLAKNQDDINLNAQLFKRIKTVYDLRAGLKLSGEDKRLLEKTYKDFVRGGANLSADKKDKLRKLNEELSLLGVQFGNNLLKETNAFELVIDKKEDLGGLPASLIEAAASAAKDRKLDGKWVFTLHSPSIFPFLQYSEKRDLREKIYKAYINRGSNNNNTDNKAIVSKVISLRYEKAKLLGFRSYAHFVLDKVMAKTPENVYTLLTKIWDPALALAGKEAVELQKIIIKEGKIFKLQPWDWWFYSEKLRKEKYDLDDAQLRPYFKLENVRDGAFSVANKLYGITFTERKDIPTWHPDVKVFEVKEADGKHIGILYTDYFPRASKRGGAWMSELRRQYKPDGKEVTPVVFNVCNFTEPAGDAPALLTFDEVSTLFHEFGHALHGLLSDCSYYSLAGTEVPRDFVELPSQIMENWAGEPKVLKMFAKHYKTGETIPDALIKKIVASSKFNQGFATVEFTAAALLDMDWHVLETSKELDVNAFENKTAKKIGLLPEIGFRYRSTYFSHIFSNDYCAGYYSYLWAEVLDADAFEAFKEKGIFDKATADSFRKNILSKGGSEEGMVMYKKFRGKDPDIKPLLKRRGILN
jgi:peptidyl-dipeptidase Dcp